MLHARGGRAGAVPHRATRPCHGSGSVGRCAWGRRPAPRAAPPCALGLARVRAPGRPPLPHLFCLGLTRRPVWRPRGSAARRWHGGAAAPSAPAVRWCRRHGCRTAAPTWQRAHQARAAACAPVSCHLRRTRCVITLTSIATIVVNNCAGRPSDRARGLVAATAHDQCLSESFRANPSLFRGESNKYIRECSSFTLVPSAPRSRQAQLPRARTAHVRPRVRDAHGLRMRPGAGA